MNNNIYCRYAGTTNKKSRGFSIAYAIVSLVVVAVVLAGLTPVLTRKLPNLSTSSIIKNPKGWYESFNAPTEGAVICKNCKQADDEYKKCLEEQKKDKNKICPYPEELIKTTVTIKPDHECFGNPACIPYVIPKKQKEEEKKPSVIPFEQYCKSNGKCNPDPDILKDVNEKLCHDANYTITGKLKDKLKPCPCPKGKCKFKPQSGITKYEVYAIGGGGGSGSAVASDLADKGNAYKESVVGSAKNPLPKGNNDDLTKVQNNRRKDSTHVTYIDEHKIQIANSSLYPKADFIDQNRIDTKNNPYSPNAFKEDGNGKTNYANILNDSNTEKCATGIIYTIGKENNNFHTYPTEDSNSVLAKSSTRQIKKILGNKTYKIGERNVYYYDRYYLYTRYLGAYAYNQNPVYLLMPEWVKVDNNDKRYPNDDGSIDNAYDLTNIEGIKDDIGCKKNDCNIAEFDPMKFNPMNPDAKNAKPVTAIMNNYNAIAGVVCSGDGGAGGNAYSVKNSGDPCKWMLPNACKFDKGKFVEGTGWSKYTGTAYTNHQTANEKECDESCGSESAPGSNSDAEQYKYCVTGSETTKKTVEYKKDGKTKTKEVCDKKYCAYNDLYYNRVCKYQEYNDRYVSCKCEDIKLNPACSEANENDCTTATLHVSIDPNIASDRKLLKDTITHNLNAATDFSFDFTYIDGNSKSLTSKSGFMGMTGADWESVVDAATRIDATFDTMLNSVFGIIEEGNTNASIEFDVADAGGTPVCKYIGTYSRSAYGGPYGHGICAYTKQNIARKRLISLYTSPKADNYRTAKGNNGGNKVEKGDGVNKVEANDGGNAHDISICISIKDDRNKDHCANASGGEGGTRAIVGSVCTGQSINGVRGSSGGVSGEGSSFAKSQESSDELINYGSTKVKNAESKEKYKLSEDYYKQSSNKDDTIKGTQRKPGLYNYRYIWYMPFVTKHLMFGLAGEGGEEVHSLVTLSEGQTLDVTPGKGAVKTIHTSGANGGNGGQSEVRNDDAKVKIIAHGGKGGLGSQKTDEYVLCHISDLQNQNPNLPCYYKNEVDNSFKSTHAREKDGKFVGILATQPKISTIVKSIKMSANLKDGTPGMGAMGFGTKSVSDVICENRYVEKWDKIEGTDTPTAQLLSSGKTLYNVCRGNSRIKYIIPNGSKYTAGTGAVIIIW